MYIRLLVLCLLLNPNTILLIHCQGSIGVDSSIYNVYTRSVKQFSEFVSRFNQDPYEFRNSSGSTVDRDHSILLLFYHDDPRFDRNSDSYSPDYIGRTTEFIHEVVEKDLKIDQHSNQVRAIVSMLIDCDGNLDTINVILVQEVEELQLVRWVISGIEGASLEIPSRDTTIKRFLSPVSHELGFMDLTQAMNDPDNMIDYAQGGFVYDMLSVFLYGLSRGLIEFRQIISVEWEVLIDDRYILRIGERLMNDVLYGIFIYDLLFRNQ